MQSRCGFQVGVTIVVSAHDLQNGFASKFGTAITQDFCALVNSALLGISYLPCKVSVAV